MAATTLLTVAKQMTDPLRKGVLMTILRQSDLLQYIPFETVGGLTSKATRWKTLPTAGFRKINSGYTPGSGETEQVEWAVKPLGGDVDIDKIFDHATDYIEDPKKTQTKMKSRAVASEFNYYFVKGSPTVDADGFYGLEYIVDRLDSRQKIVVGTAGTPHDATASTANTHALLDKMHEASSAVGGADLFLCNRKLRLGIASLLRRSGLLTTSKDAFDRKVDEFDGAPIVDAGLKRDQSTEIITETEDPGDGGDDTTSLYAVKFGLDDGLIGIQLNELLAYWVNGPDGELEDKPAHRLRIDWVCGVAAFGKWSVSRVYNIEPAGSWT